MDKARAERDVAIAQIAQAGRLARKTIRAPFQARVGISDVHPGQYLNEGTQLATLQGVDPAVHVDFPLPQAVASGLREGMPSRCSCRATAPAVAKVVAVDARVDPATRNAMVRARVAGPDGAGPGRPCGCGSRSARRGGRGHSRRARSARGRAGTTCSSSPRTPTASRGPAPGRSRWGRLWATRC